MGASHRAIWRQITWLRAPCRGPSTEGHGRPDTGSIPTEPDRFAVGQSYAACLPAADPTLIRLPSRAPQGLPRGLRAPELQAL